jgi:hypothetical protein
MGISDRRLVNQVANLAYVEWPENLAIRAMSDGGKTGAATAIGLAPLEGR